MNIIKENVVACCGATEQETATEPINNFTLSLLVYNYLITRFPIFAPLLMDCVNVVFCLYTREDNHHHTILKNIHTVYKLHVECSVGDDASAFAYVLVRCHSALKIYM